jgi:hypothetical protein
MPTLLKVAGFSAASNRKNAELTRCTLQNKKGTYWKLRPLKSPSASLVPLAEAIAFQPALKLARRDALWAIEALRDETLPLFAAAARKQTVLPKALEPTVFLKPMTSGGEVVSPCRSDLALIHWVFCAMI